MSIISVDIITIRKQEISIISLTLSRRHQHISLAILNRYYAVHIRLCACFFVLREYIEERDSYRITTNFKRIFIDCSRSTDISCRNYMIMNLYVAGITICITIMNHELGSPHFHHFFHYIISLRKFSTRYIK